MSDGLIQLSMGVIVKYNNINLSVMRRWICRFFDWPIMSLLWSIRRRQQPSQEINWTNQDERSVYVSKVRTLWNLKDFPLWVMKEYVIATQSRYISGYEWTTVVSSFDDAILTIHKPLNRIRSLSFHSDRPACRKQMTSPECLIWSITILISTHHSIIIISITYLCWPRLLG